jgi:hypothetical protein
MTGGVALHVLGARVEYKRKHASNARSYRHAGGCTIQSWPYAHRAMPQDRRITIEAQLGTGSITRVPHQKKDEKLNGKVKSLLYSVTLIAHKLQTCIPLTIVPVATIL